MRSRLSKNVPSALVPLPSALLFFVIAAASFPGLTHASNPPPPPTSPLTTQHSPLLRPRPRPTPPTPRPESLMGLLGEWMYPGSKFGGAEMTGLSNHPPIQGVYCKSVLTTADSFDKVVGYYEHKFGPAPVQSDAGPEAASTLASSIQDDSKNRPVLLRVIVVNRGHSSTTLVISRAAGETKTHIAWSHFQNLSAD